MPSQPNDDTVRIFIIAYIIKLDESLYAASVLSLNPVFNDICIIPAIIINGNKPKATSDVLH